MLLGWLGEKHAKKSFGEAQAALDAAMAALIRLPATRTRDLGGDAGTRAMTDAIVEKLKQH